MIAKPTLYKDLDPKLKTWLYASGSLTQQLTQLAGGIFHVEPTRQYFHKMSLMDSQWMKMPAQHISWVRESLLYGCEQQAWVEAKSIFPIMSLQGRARLFQHIGSKPIGKYLFDRHQPDCQRRVVKLAQGWTRQSCYTWHGCRFIVQETFLPAFEHYLMHHQNG